MGAGAAQARHTPASAKRHPLKHREMRRQALRPRYGAYVSRRTASLWASLLLAHVTTAMAESGVVAPARAVLINHPPSHMSARPKGTPHGGAAARNPMRPPTTRA